MLREATDDDIITMLRWRNHPKVRAASLTTHEIGEDEHRRWWSRVRDDKSARVLIYEHAGVPSGVVQFTLADDAADWGFYLDTDGVEAGGQSLRVWVDIEREAIAYAFDELGVTLLRGVTLAWNGAVRGLHKRFGFRETGTFVQDIDGVPTEVVQTELRAEERRTR